MSQIKDLIGAPAGRTDGQAAAHAAYAEYVLGNHHDYEARDWAIRELGECWLHDPQIQQAMLHLFKTHPSANHLAEYLSAAGLFPEDVIPVLVAWLDKKLPWAKLAEELYKGNPFSDTLQQDMRHLARYGNKALSAVPHLIKALAFSDDDLVCETARTLGEIGAGAVEAVPALKRIADDSENPAAQECRNAVDRILS